MAEMTESKNFIHAFIDEDIAPGGQFAGQTVEALTGQIISSVKDLRLNRTMHTNLAE